MAQDGCGFVGSCKYNMCHVTPIKNAALEIFKVHVWTYHVDNIDERHFLQELRVDIKGEGVIMKSSGCSVIYRKSLWVKGY